MVVCPNCGEENPPKFRLCGYCGTPLAAAAAPALPPHEVRKTVTIVFCDLKGSTALGERLDAEALHEVKERYFRAMAAEIERHGGKIEKYIGDAIMAIFGLPRAHEDDALRAVRSAAGMNAALAKVNVDLRSRYGVELANRTGVNTGEVVANDDPNATQKLATGDAVNVAARLEQAAGENEIFLGGITWQLVRDAVEVEPVEPLELKGKAERVAAYRLVSAAGLDGNVRRVDTPIVGREAELSSLSAAWQQACEQRAARLVTNVGEAGMGKSRLVHEVLERVAIGARVLRGRCLAYGEGITFWPLVGMVRGAAAIGDDDAPETAREKVLALVGAQDVADRLASAIGLSAAPFPLHELYWGARKFLEALAAHAPVAALVDDIHWAQPAFLDLLENLLDTSSGAPILLLATARPDLIEERPQWSERAGATRLVLKPLDEAAAAEVVKNLLGRAGLSKEVRNRIVAAAEGNPLFVEQMLSMLIDSRALKYEEGRWRRDESYNEIIVPPTIQALLEARLDKLMREVRVAVESASVIGLEFVKPAVEAISPEALRPTVGEHLATLTRKQFIDPANGSEIEARFRFHHHMVRDTAYNGLLKRARANLHIDFVRWADKVNAERDRALEFEEILGYHLEQAHRYLSELGPLDEKGLALGRDAARRLSSAAKRAFARGDMHAAASLYRRAVALLPADDAARLALLPDLAETLMELADFAQARTVLGEALAAAERTGNERLNVAAQLVDMLVRLYSAEPGDWGGEALRLAEEAMPVLERAGAHDEIANAWRVVGFAHGIAGRYGLVAQAVTKCIEHARRAGDARLVARTGLALSTSALYGPTPVAEAIAQCERIIADGLADRQVEGTLMCTMAQLRAMNAEFDLARSLYRRGRALLRDLGQGVNAASTALDVARVELLAGDLPSAEREVQADFEFLRQRGETYFLSTIAALLSRILRDQGRDGDALAFSKTAEAAASADDIESQVLWRCIRAPLLARMGQLDEAREMAVQAVAMSRNTEAPALRADALEQSARVLHLCGRTSAAAQAIGEAIDLYGAKGDRVSLARARGVAEEIARAAAMPPGPAA
jgi:class 3 adenylate cyclase/tetratricopeptide (TPR) repeat protein